MSVMVQVWLAGTKAPLINRDHFSSPIISSAQSPICPNDSYVYVSSGLCSPLSKRRGRHANSIDRGCLSHHNVLKEKY